MKEVVCAQVLFRNRDGSRLDESQRIEGEDRYTLDPPPPPSESAAFKDLGEPSSPESRLHMLYVPNARGGSRSWTGGWRRDSRVLTVTEPRG